MMTSIPSLHGDSNRSDPLSDATAGSLFGLAIGDAMGAPTEGMRREDIERLHGRVENFLDADAAGTDDTEYAVLTAQMVVAHGRGLTADHVADHWLAALSVQDGGFYGAGFSEMVALANLQAKIRPPASGALNYEMCSDGAAMRIAPVGLFAVGDPELAMRLAMADASVSHAGDGVWAAQAVAASIAVAAKGDGWQAAIDQLVVSLPADSWSLRMVRRAIDIALSAPDPLAAEAELYRRLPLWHYPWADVVPEALALTVGIIVAHEGALVPSIVAGVNMGRDSDTIAAMAGAICGAAHGAKALPAEWVDRVRMVRGRCITATSGVDLMVLAGQIDQAREAR